MKKNKNIIIILALIVGVPMCFAAFYLGYDWYGFISQTQKTKNYISSIKGIEENNMSSDKHCSYSHQKYSKGSLGCSFLYSFTSDNKDLFNNSNKMASKFGWTFKWNNTIDNNKYSAENYIKSEVYEHKNLFCSFVIIEKSNSYIYKLGCSGPAKAEWFPVREN